MCIVFMVSSCARVKAPLVTSQPSGDNQATSRPVQSRNIPLAQQKIQAQDAYDNRDFPGLLDLAESGNRFAQAQVGYMYSVGMGVKKNENESIRFFELAAAQGVINAQMNLGAAYADGRGVKKDYSVALNWYRKAADAGDAGAQNGLGVMYEAGQGVKKDVSEALKYYSQAAKGGNANATFALERLGKIKRFTTLFICNAPGKGGQYKTLGAALYSDLLSNYPNVFSSRITTSPWSYACTPNSVPFTNLGLLAGAEKKAHKGNIYYFIDQPASATAIGVVGSQ